MHISSPKFLIPFLAIAGIIGALAVAAVDDTTPPSVVADLSAPTTTATSVGLRWTAPGDDGATGTAASYDMRYRTTGPIDEINFVTSTAVGGEPVPHVAGTIETMTVSGLSATTTYWFALRATDDGGNTSAISNVVSTTTPADATAPIISGITVTNLATTSARVNWSTDESANSQVNFGTTTGYGSSTSSADMVTSRGLDVSSLLPATLYHFIVISTDAHGNTATSSDATFTTLTPSDVTAPIISGITVTDIATTTATVRWTTNESVNSLVRYGTTSSYGTSASSASLVTTHAIPLSSLTPSTLYHFAVSSADGSGNTATSSDVTFSTLATSTPDTAPPSISGITVTDIGTTSATVRWSTNESSNSLVRFGTTTAYGLSANNASFVTTHAIPLSSLSASTLYHFAVSSADVLGNTATSSDHTFTTFATSTPTTTIAARLKIEPHKISLTKKPNKIGAIVKLPSGMNFEGLNENSLMLNGTVHPLTVAIGDGTCTCDGAQGYALRLTFPVDQVLALIPSTTDSFTFTLTGTATAGSFSGSDTVKIAASSDDSSPCGRFEEVFERKSHKFERQLEKAEKRMEKKQEQLENRQEKIRGQFEKQRERFQDKMQKLRERFNHDNDDDDDDD